MYCPLAQSNARNFLLLWSKRHQFTTASKLIRWATRVALNKLPDQETWNLSSRLDNSHPRLSEGPLLWTCYKHSNKFKGASIIATNQQLNPRSVFLTPSKGLTALQRARIYFKRVTNSNSNPASGATTKFASQRALPADEQSSSLEASRTMTTAYLLKS